MNKSKLIDKNSGLSIRNTVILIIVHILLGFAADRWGAISTLHAVITLFAAIILVLRNKETAKVIMAAAYITGAEVLWRMTDANIFWEFGKYAVIGILVLAMLRQKRAGMVSMAILFIGLMTISIPLTFINLPFGDARQAVSFNLSGPLTLAVSVMYFSQVGISKADLSRVIFWFAAPVVSIATINISKINSYTQIIFSDNSNFATSGGFGPNQVSAILGLAGLFLILEIIVCGAKWHRVWLSLGLSVGFFVLSGITFSRGGLYNVAASLIAVLVLSSANPKVQLSFIFFLLVLWGSWKNVILPKLDAFTGGSFLMRFTNLDTTGRLELAQTQLELWKRNFIFGVGPGMGGWEYLKFFGRTMAAHTEYSRMLLEHGIFGFGSLILMLVMPIRKFFSNRDRFSNIWLGALVVWSLVEMSHSATRIAAVGFVFGFGFLSIIDDHEEK